MRVIKYNVLLDENKKNTLVAESTQNRPEITSLNSPDMIVNLMNLVFQADRQAEEHLWLVALNTKGKLLGVFEVSHGTIRESLVSAREIFVRLCLCGATSFVLCHNHPSGDSTPSRNDVQVTRTIKDAADLMGIAFCDHIIIGDGVYYSFREEQNVL